MISTSNIKDLLSLSHYRVMTLIKCVHYKEIFVAKYFTISMDWNVIHTILNFKKMKISFCLQNSTNISIFIMFGLGSLCFGNQKKAWILYYHKGQHSTNCRCVWTQEGPIIPNHSKTPLSKKLSLKMPFRNKWFKEFTAVQKKK